MNACRGNREHNNMTSKSIYPQTQRTTSKRLSYLPTYGTYLRAISDHIYGVKFWTSNSFMCIVSRISIYYGGTVVDTKVSYCVIRNKLSVF